MSIRHTVHELPPRMRGRAAAVERSVRGFLAEVASAVERGAKQRLSGPSNATSPGNYPVPRPTGDLWRGMGIDAPRRGGAGWRVVVFNDAPHATVIHEGLHTSARFGPRRFMTDAADQVDQVARLQAWMERAE